MSRISTPYRQEIYKTRLGSSKKISEDAKSELKEKLSCLIQDALNHKSELSDADNRDLLDKLHNDKRSHQLLIAAGIKTVSKYSWYSNQRATGKIAALKEYLQIECPNKLQQKMIELLANNPNHLVKVMYDTLKTPPSTLEQYKILAEQNRVRWQKKMLDSNNLSTQESALISRSQGDLIGNCNIYVLNKDSCKTAGLFSKLDGTIYTVLNFANPDHFGGGAFVGASTQEETIFRASDVANRALEKGDGLEIDPQPSQKIYIKYTNSTDTERLNGKAADAKCMYSEEPYVCFKDAENDYARLSDSEVFLFKEIRMAAQIARQRSFDEEDAKRRITVLFNTLIDNNVKHVVLGAFGCGAFENPPDIIAKIFKEELSSRLTKDPDCFKSVAFAVYDKTNEMNNLKVFETTFKSNTGR